jgi:hypothetical protein
MGAGVDKSPRLRPMNGGGIFPLFFARKIQ